MKKLLLIFVFSLYVVEGYSQSNEAKEGITELTSYSTKAYNQTSNLATYIASALLAIGLIFVVYALATGRENGSKYLISWVIAVIFAILLLQFT